MFKEADALGRLTHFVYNAGIPGVAGRLKSADSTMMREVIEVNVLGALWSMQHAIRRMSKKHGGSGGSIVLLSSVAADIGGPNEYVWYAASKGAVESITYGLSKELAGDGIRVNCVSPGASETRIHADAGTPDKLARVAPMIPMGARQTGRAGRGGVVSALGRRVLHRGTVLRRRWAVAYGSMPCFVAARPYDRAIVSRVNKRE
jgi:NAD(P)-dependent dehydrogenase (short-subunit alcohol dehydrogenase family)